MGWPHLWQQPSIDGSRGFAYYMLDVNEKLVAVSEYACRVATFPSTHVLCIENKIANAFVRNPDF